MKLFSDKPIGKKQFLAEHNRLSPANLKATFELLTNFQQKEKPLLKDKDWSTKLRIPFISWLIALPPKDTSKEKSSKKTEESKFRNYPETKY